MVIDESRKMEGLEMLTLTVAVTQTSARTLYTAGLAGFLDVLDAQRSALERRQTLLRITDDGRGFEVDTARPGHFGLENMRSRAQEIGATLTLTSSPGQGSEVRVQWEEEKA